MANQLESWRKGVTIGVPIYNEEPFIEAAIRSAAPQCERLLISDNCSTDRSAAICEKLALEFDNVVIFRHAKNIGSAGNFEFVLETSGTPFFMWLGGHDMIPYDYVRSLRKRLDEDGESVMSFGAVLHVDRDGAEIGRYNYGYAALLASASPATRLMSLIRYLRDCSLVHGLFRTDAALAAWDKVQYLAGDHVFLSRAALIGRLSYEPSTFLIRRDVHVKDSKDAQLKRITGPSKNITPSYLDMQRRQFALAVTTSAALGWKGIVFRLRARFWLASRFGPFGQNVRARMLDLVLLTVGRVWVRIERAAANVRGANRARSSTL